MSYATLSAPRATAEAFLRLIAEGYYVQCQHDQYVCVENPDFQEDNGSNPYIIWDCDNNCLKDESEA